MEELLTYKEVAEYLKLSEGGVKLLVKRGLIPVVRLPGTKKVVRIRQSDIVRLMEESTVTKGGANEISQG